MTNFIDIAGHKFGRLTAIRMSARENGRTRWECKCKCGNMTTVRLDQLRNGDIKSCGCGFRGGWDIDDAWESCLKHREITSTGCWEFNGACSPNGYGKTSLNGSTVSAHRVSAAINLGFNLTSKLMVCHTCDNPPCFNPAHLFIGTAKENIQDSVRKGRNWEARKTHCPQGHKYTEATTSTTQYRSGRQEAQMFNLQTRPNESLVEKKRRCVETEKTGGHKAWGRHLARVTAAQPMTF